MKTKKWEPSSRLISDSSMGDSFLTGKSLPVLNFEDKYQFHGKRGSAELPVLHVLFLALDHMRSKSSFEVVSADGKLSIATFDGETYSGLPEFDNELRTFESLLLRERDAGIQEIVQRLKVTPQNLPQALPPESIRSEHLPEAQKPAAQEQREERPDSSRRRRR